MSMCPDTKSHRYQLLFVISAIAEAVNKAAATMVRAVVRMGVWMVCFHH